jgi:hypothetical protein
VNVSAYRDLSGKYYGTRATLAPMRIGGRWWMGRKERWEGNFQNVEYLYKRTDPTY